MNCSIANLKMLNLLTEPYTFLLLFVVRKLKYIMPYGHMIIYSFTSRYIAVFYCQQF